MAKKSFRDAATGILKAWGNCASNAVGDICQEEADDFSLQPGKWRFVAGAWQPYTDNDAAIRAQIAAIETTTIVPRFVREFALVSMRDMATREAEAYNAANPNATPQTADSILAASVGYVKAKAIDDQIRALRAQLS